ncbi:hypothetical protein B0H15DRAFT_585410 [Mycena belliarum]|uniref:GATA-type domain-containing protein n=1 Tax=Mycena belliarum TaxID=1033014 RepID=A0AAD6UER6_9AGAR|nr:hypothetical protein B0H15DRAFT_585410 [Mycena belliae]
MDSLHFAPSPYTDDNAPRTPSPPSMPAAPAPQNYKHAADPDPVRIFSQDDDAPYQWQQQHQHQPQFAARPSLLQELYEGDGLSPEHASPPDMYVDADWPQAPPPHQRPVDYTLMRRATFPYARQERPEDLGPYAPPGAFLHHDSPYEHHALPLSAEPGALHAHAHPHHPHHPHDTYSPPGYAPEYDAADPAVKLEEAHHAIPHPQQHYHPHAHAHNPYAHPSPHQQFYRHPAHPHHPHAHAQHAHAHAPHGMHFAPHGLPVQHTDDAASKETQYLRRRCFNCHTTEPPSWRRSTLHPGKIVCNKCGLYERTHLRARPLRFDELRAGNKARKGAGAGAAKGQGSPKAGAKRGGAAARRSSVSSTGSSAQSGSSDWDDSGSAYSAGSGSGSAPPTSFSSPAFSPHPPPLTLSPHAHAHGHRDSLSRSPPHSAGLPGAGASSGNGIRLPHAPDIPALNNNGGGPRGTKPRSNTTGGLGMGMAGYYSSASTSSASSSSASPSNGGGYPQLHHASSSSSLHSVHSQHSAHSQHAGSPMLPPMQTHHGGGGGGSPALETLQLHDGEVFRRNSVGASGDGGRWGGLGGMGSMASVDEGMGMGGGMGGMGMGMGGVSVKEEPRAVAV